MLPVTLGGPQSAHTNSHMESGVRVAEDRSEEVELAAVRRVLDGGQATAIGGYPLIGPHVAAVAWGAKRRDCMRLLAWELSGELLSVDADADTAWG